MILSDQAKLELAAKWPSVDWIGPGHTYERKMHKVGLYKIKRWERFIPRRYPDVVDKDGKQWWAIGFGHGGASGVWPSQEEIASDTLTLTLEQGIEILDADLAVEYVPGVDRAIVANATQDMFNACVIMAFNMGMTKWKKTSVLTNLNNAKYVAACASFVAYNRARNPETKLLEVRNGLTCRRCDEASLFENYREGNR